MSVHPRVIDLTGQCFGRLTVLQRSKQNAPNGNARWYCRCDCGQYVTVDGYRLRHGMTASCGCLRAEKSRKRAYRDLLPYVDHEGKTLKNADGTYYSSLVRSKRNHSGTVGVSFDATSQRYIARLRYHGRYVLNKATATKAEAVALRQAAERKYFHAQNCSLLS